MASIAEAIGLALQYHRGGAFVQAEQICRQILQADPRNSDALHLMGVLASEQGNQALAIDYLMQAARLQPTNPLVHHSLGVVCLVQGLAAEAMEHYRRAIQLKPDYIEAYTSLGTLFRQLGQLEQARACFQEAVRHGPHLASAHNNLGVVLRESGRNQEALVCYQNATQLDPGLAEGHNNLASLLHELGRYDESLRSFREALRLNPAYADAYSNLGNLWHTRGQHEEALACYREAVRLRPDFAAAHNNFGAALLACCRPEEALASFEAALRYIPRDVDVLTSRGRALQDLGRVEEALASFEQALAIQPDFAEARMSRGVVLLLTGRLEQGWSDYEWRVRCKTYAPFALPLPFWKGGPLAGKTILLLAEQGLGDALQFLRYVPLVKKMGATVIVGCPTPLGSLFAGYAGVDRVVLQGSPCPAEAELQAFLPSLPGLFRTTLDTIPATIPYLTAEEDRVKAWRKELEPLVGFKVGIAWQGSVQNNRDRWRSVPLTQFAPLARIPGIHLVSLQVGPGCDQIRNLNGLFAITDLGSRFDPSSFAAAAAVVKNLDLVITVDTALAHLAGGLGAAVWVAVPFAPDWRWFLDREDSPWYPSMRLFRQRQLGKWEEVFERMADELAKLLRDRAVY